MANAGCTDDCVNIDQCIGCSGCVDSTLLYGCSGLDNCTECAECAGLTNEIGWFRGRPPENWEPGWAEEYAALMEQCRALPQA